MRPRGRTPICADTGLRPRGREKNKIIIYLFIYLFFKYFFLVVLASLERENFFSIFNFRFSIPKIPKLPKLPELCGLRGRSCEKKKVFSA
jgi:hypothetical protein